MKFGVKKLATMAVLSALSIALMLLIKFPLIPAAPYLIYEPADVPIFIGAFLFGPMAGLLITVVVSAIQASMSPDGWVGFVMHVLATGTFVVLAGLIYRKLHNIKGAIIALVSGTIAMTLIMIPANLVIQTLFRDMEFAAVAKLLIPVIIPFNLLKAGLNSIITFVVYKRISNIFHRLLKDTAAPATSSCEE
ncbi:MAG: ECF transporter S component [Acetivibrionales bacterium]